MRWNTIELTVDIYHLEQMERWLAGRLEGGIEDAKTAYILGHVAEKLTKKRHSMELKAKLEGKLKLHGVEAWQLVTAWDDDLNEDGYNPIIHEIDKKVVYEVYGKQQNGARASTGLLPGWDDSGL